MAATQYRPDAAGTRVEWEACGEEAAVLHGTTVESDESGRGLAVSTQIQHAPQKPQIASAQQPVGPAGQQQRSSKNRSSTGELIGPAQGQRPGTIFDQRLQPGQHPTDAPRTTVKVSTGCDERSSTHQAPVQADHSGDGLAVSPQVQHPPLNLQVPGGKQPVVPSGQQQRSLKDRGPARVSVHPAQTERPGAALHQSLRSAQRRSDRSCTPVKRRTDGIQVPVLHRATVQADHTRTALAVPSQIQYAPLHSQVSAREKPVGTAIQQERSSSNGCAAAVRVLRGQNYRSIRGLCDAVAPADHSRDGSALKGKACACAVQKSVANHPARHRHQTGCGLGSAPKIQRASDQPDGAARGKKIVTSGKQERAVQQRGATGIAVRHAQSQGPGAALEQPLSASQHRVDGPGFR